jgi:flagellar hook assembly protein FlgD
VDVVIRNVAGVIVRRVTAGQVAVAGTNTVLWNGRADSGSRVPAGHYLLELTARSPKNGQANSVIATLNVTR